MHSQSAELIQSGPAVASAPTTPALLDQRHLDHQTLGDPVLRRDVLELFLAESIKYIDDLFAADDCKSWRMAVHTLKGVSLNLGAFRLAAVCRQFETPEAVGTQPQKRAAAAAISDMIVETRSAIAATLPAATLPAATLPAATLPAATLPTGTTPRA